MALGTSPATVQAQTGTLAGQVTDGVGLPISGARVVLEGSSETTTGTDGRYTVRGTPGLTEVVVSSPGFAEARATVTLLDGRTVTLDFQLVAMRFLQEVTVTAQRREQFIQDVGISVSAHDGDELLGSGALTTLDLLTIVPSTYLQETFGGPGSTVNIGIRGVGLNDFNDGTEAPSVLYVDEFHMLPISAGSAQFYDAERVEVLRGPQGTLFGRNVTGGLVHYVTRDPSDRVEGYVRSDAGQYRLLRFEGAANVPVADRVAFRLSGVVHDNSAWATNLGAAPDGHETDQHWSSRGQLRVDLTESLESVTKVTLGRAGGNASLTQGDRAATVDGSGFVTDAGPGPFVDPRVVDDFTLGETDAPEFIDKDLVLAIERLTWEVGSATLTSISGFLDLDRMLVQDCDGTPLDSCRTRYDYGTRQFTQEVRVSAERGRAVWTVGAYYLRQDAESAGDAVLDGDGTFGGGVPGFGFGGPFIFDADWDLEVRGWAGFGQLELALSDQVTLTAGLRYSKDTKDFEMVKRDFVGEPGSSATLNADWDNLYPGVLVDGIGANVNFTRSGPDLPVDSDFDLIPDRSLGPAGDLTKRDDDLVNAKVGVDWRPNEDFLLFGSWSRGTKSGGFNNGFVTIASNAEVPFGPEKLDAFEIGMKTTVRQTVRMAAALFHYRFDDYQAVAFQGLGTRTLNRDATVSGAEVEFSAYPFAGFETRGTLSLLDTNVEDIGNGVTTFDAEMGLAPNISVKGLIRYGRDVGPGLATAQTDLYWAGDQFADVLNQPALSVASHLFANARIAYAQGPWEVAAWVRNLTNARIPNARFHLGLGSVHTWYRAPRWVGAGLTYRW